MLKLSKKVEYALMSLRYIAALPAEEVSTAREVAEHFNIPPELLGKVLQALTRGDLIESVQGARGGYRLCRKLNEISLGEVIEAVDGPVHVVPCTGDQHNCDQEAHCNIKDPIDQIQIQLQRFVNSVSLDALGSNSPFDIYLPPEERSTHVLLEE